MTKNKNRKSLSMLGISHKVKAIFYNINSFIWQFGISLSQIDCLRRHTGQDKVGSSHIILAHNFFIDIQPSHYQFAKLSAKQLLLVPCCLLGGFGAVELI